MLAAGCASPVVDGEGPAYDPTSLTAGQLYRWPLGRELAVFVDPAGAPASVDLSAVVQRVSSAWANALGYGELSFRIASTVHDADILVRDPRSTLPVDTAGCGGPGWTDAAGSAFFCPAGDTARTFAALTGLPGQVKVIVTVDREATASALAFEALVAHEFGHALGIGGHSPNANDVMFAAPAVIGPSRNDSRTLRYVLHRHPNLIL
jgi:predicted Zn-dependent protease